MERQWGIVERLLLGPRSRAQLARDFGVNPRTVRRDLDALARFFPISESREGREIVYALTGKSSIPEAGFTAPEATALALAGRLVSSRLAGTPWEAAHRAALDRLTGALPPRLRAFIQGAEEQFSAPAHPRAGKRPPPGIFEVLYEAVRSRRTVQARYWSLHRDAETEREIDPYGLVLSAGTMKVVGWCHWRKNVQLFSLEHFRDARLLDERFEPPPDFSLDDWLERGFAGFIGEPMTVKVRVRGRTARWVAEREWHSTQKIKKTKAGILLTFRAGGLDAIARWVLWLGPEAEVVGPEELRKEVASRYEAGCPVHGSRRKTLRRGRR